MTKRNTQSYVGTPKQKMLNVRVEADFIERLRVVAQRSERTVSQEARHVLGQHVEAAEREIAEAA